MVLFLQKADYTSQILKTCDPHQTPNAEKPCIYGWPAISFSIPATSRTASALSALLTALATLSTPRQSQNARSTNNCTSKLYRWALKDGAEMRLLRRGHCFTHARTKSIQWQRKGRGRSPDSARRCNEAGHTGIWRRQRLHERRCSHRCTLWARQRRCAKRSALRRHVR